MTLFNCQAKGVFGSGRPWSFAMDFSSSSSVATVEADWLAQVTSAWTNGSHGLQILFPTTTVLETTRTAQLLKVTVTTAAGPVDKMREVLVNADNPALAGTSANAAMTDQDAIVVSLRSDVPGRIGTGRIHLPSPDVTLVTFSELALVDAQRCSTAIIAILTGMGGAGHQAVILTRQKTKAGGAVGDFRSIGTAETDRVIRTIRVRSKRRRAVYA